MELESLVKSIRQAYIAISGKTEVDVMILYKGTSNGITNPWIVRIDARECADVGVVKAANELYKKLAGKAFGELEGNGTWYFEETDGITYVQYHWNVVTNKGWMNYLSFLLKPAFNYNHNIVMRWGAEGLAKKLNATLISY